MSKAFNLTAQINLQGPQNLRPIVSSIRKQLSGISVDIKFNIDTKASKTVDATKKKIDVLNQALISATSSAQSLNSVLASLSNNLSQIQNIGSKTATTVGKTATNMQASTKNIKAATTQMEEFGKQSFLAVKRFAAFSLATGAIYSLIRAIDSGFRAFINFDKELIRLQQVTGQGVIGLKSLTDEITRLSVTMGISSEDITNVAVTLAQAGLSADETKVALEALAKSSLAPSFDNIAETTEGAIAVLRQFGLQANELEAALGSINAVSAAFAVEAGDIIAAIQRTGGVFAAASKGVTQGKDALNEFIAVFTSVRQTTRESAETIATGLRTIFTRIQRAKTIDLLKEFGVELQDLEGKFVGPFEAVKRLSEVLNQLDPRDIRFSSIVEELGGFRQIGKVIPLIQQFAVAQQALSVAQKGQNSLSDAQAIAQKSLALQIGKVREQFLALIRDVGQSSAFKALTTIVLGLASGLISLAGAFKPILPLLGLVAAIKGASAIGEFASGFFGGVKKGGGAGSVGQNIGENLSGAKEKEKADTTSKASEAIRENTTALKELTGSVQTLIASTNSTIDTLKNINFGGASGGTTLSSGGKVLGFNRGGVVPGSGRGDKVPALLEPGEVVMNNSAVNKYGRGNLVRMNKYAIGGKAAYIADPNDTEYQSAHFGGAIPFTREQFIAYSKIYKNSVFEQSLREAKSKLGPKASTEKIMEELGIKVQNSIKLSLPRSFNQALKTGDPGLVDQNDLLTSVMSGDNLFKNFTKKTQLNDDKLLRSNIADAIKKLNTKKTKDYKGKYDVSQLTNQDLSRSVFDEDRELNTIKDTILQSVSQKEGQRLLDNIDILFKSPKEDLQYRQQSRVTARKSNLFAIGGKIQKFMAGSPGGIRVASGKGRGVEGSKGARSYIEPISSETYLKWAKGIYDEYDADSSLVMAAGPGGLRRPPEIALADMLLAQYALETGGAGLSVGQKFVRTPSANITDELRPYLVPDPSDPNELGFFKDDVVKFGKLKKIPQQVSSEISQRKTTSKMQRELFGFALEGVAKSVRDKTLTKQQLETLSPDVLEALSKDPQSQVFSLPKLKPEVASGSSTLLDTLKGPLSEFRKSGGQTSLSGAIPEAAAKQIEAALPGYIDSVSDDSQKASKAKTTQKYFRSFIEGGTAEKPGHATAFAETINQMLKSGTIQGFADGGMVQRFMAGSIGGVAPSLSSMTDVATEFKPGTSIPNLIKQISDMGGSSFIRENLGVDKIQEILNDKIKSVTKPPARKLIDSRWLGSSRNNSDLYIPAIQEIIKQSRVIFDKQQLSKKEQIDRNQRAEAGDVYQFGLASIYGPNGELGYSGLSDAKEIETKDGQKLNTQIVRRGLPKRYEDDVQKTRQDIAALSSKAAERFSYTNIFGTGGPLAFDFDDTLVKNADIFDKAGGIDIEGYNDLTKVEEALKNAELTLLGKELKRRVGEDPKLFDNIRVLTARPPNNAPLLSSTLSRLKLPIPESKITGVSGGLNKVNNLSELETLIDDNLENVQSVMAGGKKATLYKEPRNLDLSNPSSLRSMQVIEGYTLEDMVRDQTGINITSDDVLDDPLKPIDFPNGLGAYASMWNMPPNIPTDTKRSNTSTASSVMFNRAEKFYNDNLVPAFAFGGKADGPGFEEIRQQIIDKYPEIDFGIRKRKKSSGFGYNLTGALKATGGLSGKDSVNFQQPTNLKQLQEYSDKLASKLMNPEEFAVGGLLNRYNAGSPGGVSDKSKFTTKEQWIEEFKRKDKINNTSSFDANNNPLPHIDDFIKESLTKKQEKNFGQIALRTGSRIQATYIKAGEAGDIRSGEVIADNIGNSLYSVQSSSATKGYGPKLYDIVMEAATAAGGMLTSDRRTVSDAAKGVWAYYFKNRSDVQKTPLGPENWVSSSRLLDPKLYGPPETWPAPTDPAWILQSGYSKAPSDINNPDLVVKKLASGGLIKRFASGGTVPAMVSNGEAFVPPNVAKKIGYSKLDKMNQADRNGMKGFAAGGISTFKGAGNGTSDSIGPIGLPTGSYVIREKATKALGLNKGGSVGLAKFKTGKKVGAAPIQFLEGVVKTFQAKDEAGNSGKILSIGLAKLEDILAASLVQGKLSASGTYEVAKVVKALIDVNADGDKESVAFLSKVYERLDVLQQKKGGDPLQLPKAQAAVSGLKGVNVSDLEQVKKIFQAKSAISPGAPGTEALGALDKIIEDLKNGLISNKEATAQLATAIRVSAISAEKAGNKEEAQDLQKIFKALDKRQQDKGGTQSLKDVTDIRLGLKSTDKSKPLGDLSGLPGPGPMVTGPVEFDTGEAKVEPDSRREQIKGEASMASLTSGKDLLTVLKEMRDGTVGPAEKSSGTTISQEIGGIIESEIDYGSELSPFFEAITSGRATFEESITGLSEAIDKLTQEGNTAAAEQAKALQKRLQKDKDYITGATDSPAASPVGAFFDARFTGAEEVRSKSYETARTAQAASGVGGSGALTIGQELGGLIESEIDYGAELAPFFESITSGRATFEESILGLSGAIDSLTAEGNTAAAEQAKALQARLQADRDYVAGLSATPTAGPQLKPGDARFTGAEEARTGIYDKAKEQAGGDAAILDGLIAAEEEAIKAIKLRAESEAYLAEMAKRSGMSLSEFKDKIISEGSATIEKLQDTQGNKDDLKFAAIGSRQIFKSGTKEQKESATADLKAKLSSADPSLSMEQLDEAVKSLTESMQSMTWDEAVAANDALTQAMQRTVTSQEALEQAYLEAVEKYGDAVGSLEDFQADISQKQKVDTATKDFGQLGKLFPDLTAKFASSKLGGGLMKAGRAANDSKGFGDLVGGGLSKIIGKDLGSAVGSKLGGVVSKLGGPITALGAAASVLGDNMPALYKQFDQVFGTTLGKSETAAGVAGAISGAGTGAATGATLGSFIPVIGPLIGGIGGAIIGGIQGFFRAKIAKQLENSLQKLSESTIQLDKAFEEFDLNPTVAGFEKAEKAFGDVTINAGKLDSMAQANTSYFNPLSYVSGPSEDVKQEAIRARSTAATKSSEAAQRLGSERLKSVSTEDIGRQLTAVRSAGTDPEALKAAYGELAKGSVIIEEYQRSQLKANGINIQAGESLDQYTSAQAQGIKAQAEEQAALDAYRDAQVKSGKPVSEVEAEIVANRNKAVASGRQVIGEQTALIMKQAELARATKELQLASTNLLEVFKRVVAGVERLSNEQDKYISGLSGFVDDLGGSGKIGPVDRTNEQVLSNPAAYSVDEIRAVAGNVAGLTGGTDEANQFANTAVANKIIQDELPTILAQTEGQNVEDVMDRLESSIGMALPGMDMRGPAASGINQIMEQIKRTLEQNRQSRQGTTFDEIAQEDALGIASKTAEEGSKAVLAVQKAYNDSLQKSIDLQNQAMQKYMEAAEFARKASSIRLNADLELKRALGQNVSANEMAAPAEQEITSLTEGLIKGGSLDSRQIGQAIQDKSESNRNLEKSIQDRQNSAGIIGAADPQGLEAFNAALEADKIALMNNKKAVAEASMGLKKLAEDGTRAAAALQAIQNKQNAAGKAVDFFRKILSATPEETQAINRDLGAAIKVQTKTATEAELQSPEFRRQAMSGTDMFGQLIPEAGRRGMEADMFEQMLSAGGADMNRIIAEYYDPTANDGKGGNVQLTAQQALETYRQGPEDTAEVKAYKEAVNVQANAALELGRLATVAADILVKGSQDLFTQLIADLPKVLREAFDDVRGREDAGANPLTPEPPPVVPPPTGASTAGTTPPPPLVSAGTARGAAATTVGIGGTVAAARSNTGRRVLGAAYSGVSNRTAATVAKGKDLTARAVSAAKGRLPSVSVTTPANPLSTVGGSMGAQAAKTAAAKGTSTAADNVVKTASKVVSKATQAATQATSAATKATAVVAKTASTVVGGAAKAAGKAVPFLAPVLGGVSGYMDDSAEAQKRGGVERTILGALTGDASTGSSFSGMLGVEKGGAADQALGIGGAALTGAATGAAIGSVVPVVGTAIGAAVGAVLGGGAEIYKILTAGDSPLVAWAANLGSSMMGALSSANGMFIDATLAAGDFIGSSIYGSISGMWGFITSSAEGIGAFLYDSAASVGSVIKDFFVGAFGSLGEYIYEAATLPLSIIGSVGEKAYTFIKDYFGTVFSSIGDAISSIWDWIKGKRKDVKDASAAKKQAEEEKKTTQTKAVEKKEKEATTKTEQVKQQQTTTPKAAAATQQQVMARPNINGYTKNQGQKPNEMELMNQANDEFLEARRKVTVYNQGIEGEPEDVKAYQESKEKLDKAKAAVAARAARVPAAAASSAVSTSQSSPQKPSILDDPRYQLPPEVESQLEEIQKKKEQIQTQQKPQAVPIKSLSKEENFRMRQQETGDLGPDMQQSELVRVAKLDEIRKKENRLKVSRIAATGAGTLKSSPNVSKAQEALDFAKQDLKGIDERLGGLNQKYVSPDQQKQQSAQQQLAELDRLEKRMKEGGIDMNRVAASYFDPTANEGKGGEAQLTTQQALDSSRKKLLSDPTSQGLSSSGRYKMSPEEQDFMTKTSSMTPSLGSSDIENMASQLSAGFANNQYITEAGVLMAQSFTSSMAGGIQINSGLASAITATETGQVAQSPGVMGGTTIILDENSKQFLSNFNITINKIGNYIEQLSGINIPDKIELTLNIPAPLEVRITGAAGFEKLEKSTRDMAEALVSNKLDELRTELNSFSQGSIKGPASRGRGQ